MSSTMRLALLLSPLLALAAACGPSKAGDACDLNAEEDPCPETTVCQADDEGNGRCLIALGESCEGEELAELCADGAGCGDGDICGGRGAACDAEKRACASGQVCADTNGGEPKCFPPVQLRGTVIDALDETAIEGALVLALDIDGAAITPIAESNAEGAYVLEVPAVRDSDTGKPVPFDVTLRASARDYATFPSGLRVALPIELADAEESEGAFVVQNALTTVALLELPAEQQGRASISGKVDAGDESGGVLVIADAGPGSQSAVSDLDGSFVVFNVAPGAVTVRGFAGGLQVTPVDVTVADADIEDVVLSISNTPTSTVTGSVNIVNAPGGSITSVILVVEATFNETLARGETPRGLRVENVTNEFSIAGVPDGDYVVLAGFDNDLLVRDPDFSQGGTEIVRITVDDDVAIGDSFKVTEALAVVSPGAEDPEIVTAAPDLVWADDSGEDHYELRVFDAFGDLVLEDLNIPGVSGAATVTVTYAGPLEAGMTYQFRATSIKTGGAPASTTEDLRGVFTYQP